MIMRPCYFWPFPLREMSVLMRWREKATFCALLIFEKSGDPSLLFGKPPSTAGAAMTAVATAGAWPLRGSDDGAEADTVTFGPGFAAVDAGAAARAAGLATATAPPVPA